MIDTVNLVQIDDDIVAIDLNSFDWTTDQLVSVVGRKTARQTHLHDCHATRRWASPAENKQENPY